MAFRSFPIADWRLVENNVVGGSESWVHGSCFSFGPSGRVMVSKECTVLSCCTTARGPDIRAKGSSRPTCDRIFINGLSLIAQTSS